MKKTNLLLATLFLCHVYVYGQVTFEKWYGGTLGDYGKYMVEMPDSGYAMVGTTSSFTNGGADIYFVRVNKFGDTLRTKHYGGANNEFMGSINRTADGGFIIAGSTYSFGTGTPTTFNWYLVRTNSLGDTLWTKWYSSIGSHNDQLYHAVETSDGGFILSGWFGSSTNAYGHVKKVNSSGVELWSANLASSANSHYFHACENSNGEYIISGSRLPSSSFDATLAKYSPTGTLLILKDYNYGGTFADGAQTIVPAAGGGYIVGGISGYTNSFDVWMMRVNANLDTLWTRKVIGMFSYMASISAKDYTIYPAPGGYILCGAGANNDLKIVKVDTLGNTLWTRYYGGGGMESGQMALATMDSGYAAIGYTNSYGSGGYEMYLVKTDSAGNIMSTWTNSAPEKDCNVHIYPNPSQGTFSLRTTCAEGKIEIYNITGQRITEIRIRNAETGIDLGPVPAGIYFLKLIQGDEIRIVKIVKE